MKEEVTVRNQFHLIQVWCGWCVSYIIIVISVWSYGYSKLSETLMSTQRTAVSRLWLYEKVASADICVFPYIWS